MVAVTTFPDVRINYRDTPAPTQTTITAQPLHQPLFPSFASKGPIGVPMWNDMAGHSRMFGSDMFSTSSLYAQTLPFEYIVATAKAQKFWFLRLPDGSDTLGFAIFAVAKTVKDAPLYEYSSVSGFDYTAPQQDGSGKTATADQTQLTYMVYPISTNNPLTKDAVAAYFGLDAKTVSQDVYMMMSFMGTSPGNFMTRNAIALDVTTPAVEDAGVINRIGVPLIRFYPRYCTDDSYSYLATKMTGTNYNFSPVMNVFGSNYVTFCPTMEKIVDPSNGEDYGWQPVMDTAYNSLTNGYLLDYNISVNVFGGTPMDQRGSAFNGIFALNMRLHNETNKIANPTSTPVTIDTMGQDDYIAICAINPFSGTDAQNNPLTSQPISVGSYTTADGKQQPVSFSRYANIYNYDPKAVAQRVSVTDLNIDKATRDFFNVDTGQISRLSDPFSASFNQIYDPGWSFPTKQQVANICDIRDDVKIDWSGDTFMGIANSGQDKLPKWMAPQAPVRKGNDFSGALSAILVLANLVSLHGVDGDYGTPSYRGEIFPQAGVINSSGNRKIVIGTNYERLKERLAYYSGPTVTGTPKGRPNNVLSSFQSLSWVPVTADQKQLVWQNGANYATYADVNTLFFPDLRTCYNVDTSLYSSGSYTDYINYLKGIVRRLWTYYVGREDDVTHTVTDIARDIDAAAFQAFGQYFSTETTVELQDSNTDNNYTALIYIRCRGNMPVRNWKTVLVAIPKAITKSS